MTKFSHRNSGSYSAKLNYQHWKSHSPQDEMHIMKQRIVPLISQESTVPKYTDFRNVYIQYFLNSRRFIILSDIIGNYNKQFGTWISVLWGIPLLRAQDTSPFASTAIPNVGKKTAVPSARSQLFPRNIPASIINLEAYYHLSSPKKIRRRLI